MVKTVERVLGMYAPEKQSSILLSLSEPSVGVIAQGLIRANDEKRAACHEILINTDACRDYIKKGSIYEVEGIMSGINFDDMITINASAY